MAAAPPPPRYNNNILYIPFEFYRYRDPNLALPVVNIPYHVVNIHIRNGSLEEKPNYEDIKQ